MRVSADDGRLCLPESVRSEFGDEFELVVRDDRLLLVPIPDDPLEGLREEARKSDRTARQLKESALEAGVEEAGR